MHAGMWVGGSKPVVHAVTTTADGAGRTKGALRQSDDYLRANEGWGLRVFRYTADPALGAKAATFAIEWATESNRDAVPADADFRVDKQATVRVLKTPYSEHRHYKPVVKPEASEPWSVASLFRVVKAIARKRDKMGLSPNHGVSCDQFVIYCYQAAALESYLTAGTLPTDLIAAVKRDVAGQAQRPFDLLHWAKIDDHTYVDPADVNKTPYPEITVPGGLWRDRAFAAEQKVFRSLKNAHDRNLISQALQDRVAPASTLLPKPMRRDAKTSEIDSLLRDLRAPGSGFAELGRTKRSQAGPGFDIE
jgi:hypothetical protein